MTLEDIAKLTDVKFPRTIIPEELRVLLRYVALVNTYTIDVKETNQTRIFYEGEKLVESEQCPEFRGSFGRSSDLTNVEFSVNCDYLEYPDHVIKKIKLSIPGSDTEDYKQSEIEVMIDINEAVSEYFKKREIK